VEITIMYDALVNAGSSTYWTACWCSNREEKEENERVVMSSGELLKIAERVFSIEVYWGGKSRLAEEPTAR